MTVNAWSLILKMKRSANEIMANLTPAKSAKRYNDAWNAFMEFSKEDPPTENDFIEYFDHLRHVKHHAPSSLWTYYSMINNKFQALYGEKLQKYPRITLLLKSYESGYKRKTSKFFTKDEIDSYLNDAPDEKENIYRKAAIVVGYFGGLRCADLTNIACEDCDFNATTGMWIKYKVSKQRGEEIHNKFNIPLDYCKFLETYDNELSRCNVGSGRMFKTYRARMDGTWYYTRQPMGMHTLRKISSHVAEYLKLPEPERYTGHCLRRSAANTLAEANTSSVAMKQHFNWTSENTARKYLENTDAAKLDVSKRMGNEVATEGTQSKTVYFTNCSHVIINL